MVTHKCGSLSFYLIARRSCESEKLENSRAQSTPRRASLFFCPLLFLSITTVSIPLLWSSREERRAIGGEGEGLLNRSKEETFECRKTENVEDAHESWGGETPRRSWGQRCSSIIIDTCDWLTDWMNEWILLCSLPAHNPHIKKYGLIILVWQKVSSLGVFL